MTSVVALTTAQTRRGKRNPVMSLHEIKIFLTRCSRRFVLKLNTTSHGCTYLEYLWLHYGYLWLHDECKRRRRRAQPPHVPQPPPSLPSPQQPSPLIPPSLLPTAQRLHNNQMYVSYSDCPAPYHGRAYAKQIAMILYHAFYSIYNNSHTVFRVLLQEGACRSRTKSATCR